MTTTTRCCASAACSTARGWGSRRPAATRSAPPCRTIARRRSGRAPSSSRCRRSARTPSPCRASVMADLSAAGSGAPGEPATATALRTDMIADGVLGEPAIKIFKPGSEVVYAFEIYDGRGKRKDGFSTRVTLIRDGKAFYTTPPAPRRRRAEGRQAGRLRPGRRQAVARPRPAARHLHAAGQRRAAVGQGPRSAGVAVGRLRGALGGRPAAERVRELAQEAVRHRPVRLDAIA